MWRSTLPPVAACAWVISRGARRLIDPSDGWVQRILAGTAETEPSLVRPLTLAATLRSLLHIRVCPCPARIAAPRTARKPELRGTRGCGAACPRHGCRPGDAQPCIPTPSARVAIGVPLPCGMLSIRRATAAHFESLGFHGTTALLQPAHLRLAANPAPASRQRVPRTYTRRGAVAALLLHARFLTGRGTELRTSGSSSAYHLIAKLVRPPR